ncbi:peptidase M23 [Pararhodobacter oceanensis]|uniref:Peptidase M23 n=1 Tax=Pararhodobacter oceanensis TaxID=2172121 RepID=A0A2T8HZA6_9RHOB|nr:peptidase M23 [Pararhodobacter oceanensis]
MDQLNTALERYLPEKRLFLRSETSTRFVRLRPVAQGVILTGTVAYMSWSVVATSVLFFGLVGSNDLRVSAEREQSYFETRLNEIAAQRDRATEDAQAAHLRYSEAMDRVATMQGMVLEGEQRVAELEHGIDALQSSLRSVMDARDGAQARLAELEAADANAELIRTGQQLAEVEQTLDFLMAALGQTADERETLRALADNTARHADHLALEYRLIQDRNTRIFTQLEQAVETSIVPLSEMFRTVGLPPEQILQQVRAGYQTREASLTPISVSTSGTLDPQGDESRANSVLAALAEVDLYRIAAERTPFALPVNGGVRRTSGFGARRDPITGSRGRMHNGVDWAGPRGTAIHATAGGTVTHAGRQSGFGNLVIIQHDFGIETYYAHLHSINVREGQRVSRGDRIGGMGTTGRSTGVHLHYEIRVSGRPINPLTYIRAAQNVF